MMGEHGEFVIETKIDIPEEMDGISGIQVSQ